MGWLLNYWRNFSTSTVVPSASASEARSRALRKQNQGYGTIVAARRANSQDTGLIRKGTRVRLRRDGSSPQFGSARSKAGLGGSGAATGIGCELLRKAGRLTLTS